MIENGNQFRILHPQHEFNAFDSLQMYLCINQFEKPSIIKNVFPTNNHCFSPQNIYELSGLAIFFN